ncbi:MAG: hypothetical protein ACKO9A_19015, partial [Alphaproteobacteria bacterium]
PSSQATEVAWGYLCIKKGTSGAFLSLFSKYHISIEEIFAYLVYFPIPGGVSAQGTLGEEGQG